MKTIILPGYSEHNREWAEEIAGQMKLDHQVLVHNWSHWSGGNFSLKSELDKIIKEIGKEQINIIAKSVGVFVVLNLIPKISSQVEKIILCGIASVAQKDRKVLLETILSQVPIENILCIQNENDKYVPFAEALEFYRLANPDIKVISKPRSDHHYPYPEDLQKFLKD